MVIQKMRQTLLSIERINRNTGATQWVARMAVARALNVSVNTIENIIRERVKSVSADLAAKIQAYWINTIEAEIARLEKERDLALRTYCDVDAPQMDEMEKCLEKARAMLRELARNRRR